MIASRPGSTDDSGACCAWEPSNNIYFKFYDELELQPVEIGIVTGTEAFTETEGRSSVRSESVDMWLAPGGSIVLIDLDGPASKIPLPRPRADIDPHPAPAPSSAEREKNIFCLCCAKAARTSASFLAG